MRETIESTPGHLRRFGCLALVALFVHAGTVWAAPVSYGDRSGATVDFIGITEDSGTDPTPLYESRLTGPTVSGDTLQLVPTAGFSSSVPNALGGADTTDGLLRFTIRAKVGYFIDSIVLEEFGDFSLVAVTGSEALANATGSVFVSDGFPGLPVITTFDAQRTNSPFGTGPFTLAGPGADSGGWTALASLDFSDFQVTELHFQMNNTLQTAASNGAAAFIAKKGVDISVGTRLIPEPGTLVLAAGGAAMILGTRWRDRRSA